MSDFLTKSMSSRFGPNCIMAGYFGLLDVCNLHNTYMTFIFYLQDIFKEFYLSKKWEAINVAKFIMSIGVKKQNY